MPTAHIESSKDQIAKIVIMPGDPLRAKYIQEHFLENVEVVNNVRNMTAYTGYYHGTKVTVFPSGMGIPSACIYAYELYKFYDVEKIIRIGTCGTKQKDINLLEVILADSAYSLSSFPQLFDQDQIRLIEASKSLSDQIELTAKEKNMKLYRGNVLTSDIFDAYVDLEKYEKNYPEDLKYLAAEMEAFGLFYIAKKLNRQAACLLTVVDSYSDKKSISSKDREQSLNNMISLALDSISNKN